MKKKHKQSRNKIFNNIRRKNCCINCGFNPYEYVSHIETILWISLTKNYLLNLLNNAG